MIRQRKMSKNKHHLDKLAVFQKRTLVRIYGPKWDKVTGQLGKLQRHHEELHYTAPNIMSNQFKDGETGNANCTLDFKKSLKKEITWETQE
jgi:hypothetical protein